MSRRGVNQYSGIDRKELFMDKVVPEPNTGCWLWLGCYSTRGYPIVWFDGYNTNASRVAYRLFRGYVPMDMTVDHLCRNIGCVNPDHLDICSRSENRKRAATIRLEVKQVKARMLRREGYSTYDIGIICHLSGTSVKHALMES